MSWMVSSASGETNILPSIQMGGIVKRKKARATVDYNTLMASQTTNFFWNSWNGNELDRSSTSVETKVLTSFQWVGGMVQGRTSISSTTVA